MGPFIWLAAAASLLLSAADPVRELTSRTKLSAVTEIQGYSCAAGYAWFFADGKLSSCSVAGETIVGEITVPAKSWVYLRHDGSPRFVFLAQDTAVRGFACRGGGGAEGWSTALYPSGKLKTCWLTADSEVDGVPCMRASFMADVLGGGVETDFYENGKLKACKLSRDVTLEGRALRRGDPVRFDDGGRLGLGGNRWGAER